MAGREAKHRAVTAAADRVKDRDRPMVAAAVVVAATAAGGGGFVAAAAVAVAPRLLVLVPSTWKGRVCDPRSSSRKSLKMVSLSRSNLDAASLRCTPTGMDSCGVPIRTINVSGPIPLCRRR